MMIATEQELREMEQDMFQMERAQIENICREVMMSEIKDRLFDYEIIKEELRQLNEGERVVLPKDKEHAKFMLIIAMNYLGIKPGESFSYGSNDK
jgi:SpoVK/Ycf46/Vps4 family AAA+-type ATPase